MSRRNEDVESFLLFFFFFFILSHGGGEVRMGKPLEME